MIAYEIKTNTLKETMELAHKVAAHLEPGDVITLEGQLGVGKTAFTKGIAEGLGVKDTVTSPTFTIVKEYEGKLPLYHMDAYRLEHSEEDIGFDEYFMGDGISVVEWAQFIESYLPSERLDITIDYVDEQSRIITFNPQGSRYDTLVRKIKE